MNPLVKILDAIGDGVIIGYRALLALPSLFRQWSRFIDQCLFMGYSTVPLVALLSFFIGAVLALQMGYSLRAFNINEYIGSIVGLSMVRELSPVMTAIMITGRIGSATTAELASMKVYQEVDALVTMNIPPERFLVLPRLAAIFIVTPILFFVSVVAGWIGGQVITQMVTWIGLTPNAYYESLKQIMEIDDLTDGLIKTQCFGLGILLIACTTGLRTRGGPREIGASVTLSVVICIIFILVSDYFITNILI